MFITGLTVGGGSDADWGLLLRADETMHQREEAKSLREIQCVRNALRTTDTANRAGNLRFLLMGIDYGWRRISSERIESILNAPGRRGAHAIVALLSIESNVHVGSVKQVTSNYEKAEAKLRKKARADD